MSKPIIETRNISKCYRLGAIGATSLRDDLNRLWGRVSGKDGPSESKDFWALKDVSFDIQPGEVVGIIGRNGAGKSTLLKILSRITDPSSGEVIMRGRVASLLEVGTGFHGDLSGRENIFINGAVLGMKKQEISRKFDEIVAFAGVEQFIDTPVKRYSSGMYVRLAFAVAAHLEPEILIIDEVLAVGDGDFQKKCLAKMEDVSSHGRTVLFVSHNMGMINSLCRTAILLESGSVVKQALTSDVILDYYNRGRFAPNDINFSDSPDKPGDNLARLIRGYVANLENKLVHEIDIREPFKIVMRYAMQQAVPTPPLANFHFMDARGEYVFVTQSANAAPMEPGIYEAECIIPGSLLNDGAYFVGLALTFTHIGMHVSFYERDALSFVVTDPIHDTLHTQRGGYAGTVPGCIRPQLDWKIQKIS